MLSRHPPPPDILVGFHALDPIQITVPTRTLGPDLDSISIRIVTPETVEVYHILAHILTSVQFNELYFYCRARYRILLFDFPLNIPCLATSPTPE